MTRQLKILKGYPSSSTKAKIPKDYNLQKKIVSWYYDLLSTGHPGEIKTLNAVKEHYWWPGMRTFIKNYIKGCGICQQFKINRNLLAPLFNPVPRPTTTWPFTNLSMNLITDLPPITLDNGTIMDAILSIVDHRLMKGVILTPCLKPLLKRVLEKFYSIMSTNDLDSQTASSLIKCYDFEDIVLRSDNI